MHYVELVLLWVTGLILALRVEASFEGNCLSFEFDGKCCIDTHTEGSDSLTACRPDGAGVLQCFSSTGGGFKRCMIQKLPGELIGHPVGMMSGALLPDQLVVSGGTSLPRLYSSTWTTSGTYSTETTALLACLTTTSQLPIFAIRTVPVFIQIDFIRPKKLTYLIVSATLWKNVDRRRVLIGYRSMGGNALGYSQDGVYAKAHECSTSGNGQKGHECRWRLTPFRAHSLRIAFSHIETGGAYNFSCEAGGFDYMEADHQWQFDKVLSKTGSMLFEDERGNLPLETNIVTEGQSYFGEEGAVFQDSKTAFSQTMTTNDCLFNPSHCKDGLSIAFSSKAAVGSSGSLLIAFGQNNSVICTSSTGNIGVKICINADERFSVHLMLPGKLYALTYSPPSIRVWGMYIVTWSESGGLALYFNGLKAGASSVSTVNHVSGAKKIMVRAGALKFHLHNLRVWKFQLSKDEAANTYNPGANWLAVRENNFMKFRPRSCSDVFRAFGNRTGSYELFVAKQSFELNCLNGASEPRFYLSHHEMPKWVTGPLTTNVEFPFKYVVSPEMIDHVLVHAKSCRQIVIYRCLQVSAANSMTLKGRGGAVMPFCNPSITCNCSSVTVTEKVDTLVYDVTAQLPITSIVVHGISSYDKYLHISVGSLECTAASSSSKPLNTSVETRSSNFVVNTSAGCVFPFNYKGVAYNMCISIDSNAPWCSLTATFEGRWRYCDSQLPKADIDFTMTSFQNYGDWKIGSDCTLEKNSGPCDDVTRSSRIKQKEPLVRRDLRPTETSSKDRYSCHNDFRTDLSVLSAVAFQLEDPSTPSNLESANIILDVINPGSQQEIAANLYVVVTQEKDHEKLMKNCRYDYFRAGMHFGPVEWRFFWGSIGPVTSPNIKDLLLPVLRSKDSEIRKTVAIVFEWKSSVTTSSPSKPFSPAKLSLYHKQKAPDNYLYADAADQKYPGMPLVYTTRYISPAAKCLQFWYFMDQVGGRNLLVVLKRKTSEHVVLRIAGSQGKYWRKATVPIAAFVNTGDNLFRVSFIASGGDGIASSVAIDDISFLMQSCDLVPANQNDLASGKVVQSNTGQPVVKGQCQTVGMTEWLMIDLASRQTVTSVRVLLGGGSQLNNFDVRVGNISSDLGQTVLCKGSVQAREVTDVPCNFDHGQYVYVVPSSVHMSFSFCGVEVYSQPASLPSPLSLIPLDHSFYSYGSADSMLFQQPTLVQQVLDKHGYPLRAGFFNGSYQVDIEYTKSIAIAADFTICFHFKNVKEENFTLFTLMGSSEELTVSLHKNQTISLRFLTTSNSFVVIETPVMTLNTSQWQYICFVHQDHLGTVNIFQNGVLIAERDTGFASPKVSANMIKIGHVAVPQISAAGYISCIQIYGRALDVSVIKILDLCPNHHVKDGCDNKCKGYTSCNQLTDECLCPSYISNYVTSNCANALVGTVYEGSSKQFLFDDLPYPKKFVPNFALAINRVKPLYQSFHSMSYFFIPGPVNNAVCVSAPAPTVVPVSEPSCFCNEACSTGSTLAIWLLVPPVTDWQRVGNVTLLKYCKLKVLYGAVNDMRNGTTQPIPSLMFTFTSNSETWLWVSMIHGSQITEAWSHIAVTVDLSQNLAVYYNGEASYAVKSAKVEPAETWTPEYVPSSLVLTCVDELVVWSTILGKTDIEKVYSSSVFGGERPVRQHIEIERLSYDEKNGLWGIDKSGIIYKYLDGKWVAVSEKGMRAVHAGPLGVFAVDRDNTLLKNNQSSDGSPHVFSWPKYNLQSAFWGAITELSSGPNGVIFAKSGYQWHCVDTQLTPTTWSVLQVYGITDRLVFEQLGCKSITQYESGRCWRTGNYVYSSRAVRMDHSTACSLTSHSTPNVQFGVPIKRLSFANYQWYPYAIVGSDSVFVDPLFNTESNTPINKQHPEKGSFVDIVSISGLPFGVRQDGSIVGLKKVEPFVIRSLDGRCLLASTTGDPTIKINLLCNDPFYFDESNCLVHLKSGGRVSFDQEGVKVKNQNCNQTNSVLYHADRLLRLRKAPDQCIALANGVLASNQPCGDSSKFVLQTVSQIKNVYSYNLVNSTSTFVKAPVLIEVNGRVLINFPRWSSEYQNPSSREATFACSKLTKELDQQFAGNINFLGTDCGSFSNSICNEQQCPWDCKLSLKLRHFGEEEKAIVSSQKFSGYWTDCQGLLCSYELSNQSVGVDFNPINISVGNITSFSANVNVVSSFKDTASIPVGHNLTIEGRSSYLPNWITTVRITLFKTGGVMPLKGLQPYFNYKVTVRPIFLRGIGMPFHTSFTTLESNPTEAPDITVLKKSRTSFDFMIGNISDTAWSGLPIGFRVYYQSLLKLSQPILLNDTETISSTHHHVNITGLTNLFGVIDGLEDFTNYSIIACAYNSYGVGRMRQVFNRTMQGEPEVPPPGLRVVALDSRRVHVTWSPITTDIELLNGWSLSGYNVRLVEYSNPRYNQYLRSFVLLPNVLNITVNVLRPVTEYKISVAGNVEGRAGNQATLCIQTKEEAPTNFPRVSNYTNVTSDVIQYIVGCVSTAHERGVILYYNISATQVDNNITSQYIAPINKHSCLMNNACGTQTYNCNFQMVNDKIENRSYYESNHTCAAEETYLRKTSFKVMHPLDNLRYWTHYRVRSSACNIVGCGPYTEPITIRTDEHVPTCAPNITTVQNTSSTSMFVSWLANPVSCTHGVLTHYNVYFALESELTGKECFNSSSCWDLRNPAETQTKFYVTNVKELSVSFTQLKNYRRYCAIVQAVNKKGRGPPSAKYCNHTAEDVPTGPPSSVSVTAVRSDRLRVTLELPADDVVNGIVRGYTVNFFICNESGIQSGPLQSTLIPRTTTEKYTPGLIVNLTVFTLYKVSASAYTVGHGPFGYKDEPTRTLEDVPFSPVRDLRRENMQSTSTALLFRQTIKSDINGVFRNFNVTLTEWRRDGITNTYRISFLAANVTQPPAVTNSSTPERALAVFSVPSPVPSNTTNVNFDTHSTEFSITLSGLLPFTFYDFNISTCTNVGCGPIGSVTFRTNESVPATAPVLQPVTVGTTYLNISWSELDIMDRNGIIERFRVRYMKDCEFSRLNSMPEADDCTRVISEDIKEFTVKEVAGNKSQLMLEHLAPYTVYYCEVCARTRAGYGPCAIEKYRTDEGVPSQAPVVTDLLATYGDALKVFWDNVLPPYQNGIILGYQIKYQLTSLLNTSAEEYHVINVTSFPPPNSFELTKLALKSNNTIKIAALTSKGAGKFSKKYYGETGDYRHGNWSLWSDWSFCSQSCGGGYSIKRRKCDNPTPYNGGDQCEGISNITKKCNEQICSGFYIGGLEQSCWDACRNISFYCNVDMVMDGSTTPFKDQEHSCTDDANAKYSLPYHPSYSDGKCEGYQDLPKDFNCMAPPPSDGKTKRLCDCVSPGDCGCSEWGTWSLCSVEKCGGGTKTRTRTCQSKPWCPAGDNMQKVECNTTPCPINGNWGPWSDITACNKTCGYGYRHRYRKCSDPEPKHDGAHCPGPAVYVIPECNVQTCPIHGNWGQWGAWRPCDSPCGNGLSKRKRYCDNPSPKYEGRYCEGEETEWKRCSANPCEGVEVLFTIKLTEIDWTFEYVYPGKPVTQKLTALCESNVHAVYNNSAIIKKVNMLNFAKGSVIANFTIFYMEVRQDEILLLQDVVSTTGKLYNLSTVLRDVQPVQVVTGPPQNVSAVSHSPFTMLLTWVPPKNLESIVNVSGYYVFYRKLDAPPGKWNVAGVPNFHSSNFTLTDLEAITTYRFRMTLAVKSGNGPASNEVISATKEGVPSVAPKDFSLLATTASNVYLTWKKIPPSKYHGNQLGYQIKYKPYLSKDFKIKNVPSYLSETSITSLKAFTLYYFEVAAYTGAGVGPPVPSVLKTPEGAPLISPPNIAISKDSISTQSFVITWNKISDDHANGILLGYKVKYTVIEVSGQAFVGEPITKVVNLDIFTFTYEVTGLQSYTTYEVSVSGYTGGGEGPYSKPIKASTCKCPKNVFLNWYSNPPYVEDLSGKRMTGIMADLVNSMIKSSCGQCGKEESKIYTYQSLSGENPVKTNELGVKSSIGKEFHVSFPVFGYSSITRYMESHVFILFIESLGSATIIRNEVDYAKKTISAFKSIANIWPMYLITFLFTGVFGIFIWHFERDGNEEFSQSYIKGTFQGFWWAFISMTTVGYGDITPRTIKGRIVAIIWTLAGLVLSGILLGALTSSVTTLTLPPDVQLYDTECSAVNNSFEYNLGVRRNSKVNTKGQYQTTEEVLEALRRKEVNIALVDAFAAAGMQKQLLAKSLKVKGVINANAGYGIVVSGEFVRLENDFRSYIASNQGKIASFTKNMTNELTVDDTQAEVPMLFDPSTDLFKQMLQTEGLLLAICTIAGLIYTFIQFVKKRTAKVMSTNEARLKQLASFDESVDEFEKRINKNLSRISENHKCELNELIRLKRSYQRHLKRRYPTYMERILKE